MARQTWAVEDQSNGVAGLMHGSFDKAQREALKLADFRRAAVKIYAVKGPAWELRAVVRWRPD